jgi:hypothetical protein
MMESVWVLQIWHRHGDDIWVCKTEEGARKHLSEFVSNNLSCDPDDWEWEIKKHNVSD